MVPGVDDHAGGAIANIGHVCVSAEHSVGAGVDGLRCRHDDQ